MKTTLVCGLILMQAINLNAQDKAAVADSAAMNVELGTVEVRANSVIRKADRQLYMPDATLIAQSTTGLDLLSKLKIPTIVVNPVDNTVKLASEGKLDVRINGRPVNAKELQTINPKYVTRVEYHDNPSLRYGNAEAVVDFIVKQPTSGGDLMLAAQQSLNRGWGEYNASGKVNYKKSEFSIEQYTAPRWNFGQWRDNTESYKMQDGSQYQKVETGIPTDCRMLYSWTQVGYNLTDPDKQLFSAQLSMFYSDSPKNDFAGTIRNTATGSVYDIRDANSSHYCNPTLDLYYQRNITKNQLLFFNLVGTVTPSSSDRHYTEALAGSSVFDTDITTSINGRSYSTIAEADYEISWGKSRFTAGIKHNQSWSKSTYPLLNVTDRLRQSSTYIFSEYWTRLGSHFDLTAGLGTAHSHSNEIDVAKISSWVFLPRLSVRYRMSNSSTLKLNFSNSGQSPEINQLSNVQQQIDNNQTTVGNAQLKVYTVYNTKLQYEYSRNRYYAQLQCNYSYSDNPIMDEKYWNSNGNYIISSYGNQRNAHTLGASLIARVEPIKDWLSLSGNLGFSRYIMHGNAYTHCYNNTYFNGQFDISHWNFNLSAMLMTNRNSLWGESITGGENIHILSLSYKCKHNVRLAFMTLNPFTNNYSRKSENRNQFAGYTRSTHLTAAEHMFVLGVSWNFEWGRKHQSQSKRTNNKASDNAVKAAGKG